MIFTQTIYLQILALFQASPGYPNAFDPRDLVRVQNAANEWWIERFALVSDTVEDANSSLVNALVWRNQFGINDFTDAQFADLYATGAFSNNRTDIDGRRVLVFQFQKYFPLLNDSTRCMQALAHLMEVIDRNTSDLAIDLGWTAIADASNTDAVLNTGLGFYEYFLNVIQNYYPRGWKNVLCANVPYSMAAAANVLFLSFTQEMRDRLEFVDYQQLLAYIPDDQIPDDIKTVSPTALILGNFLQSQTIINNLLNPDPLNPNPLNPNPLG